MEMLHKKTGHDLYDFHRVVKITMVWTCKQNDDEKNRVRTLVQKHLGNMQF
jgi:hypothetical protein